MSDKDPQLEELRRLLLEPEHERLNKLEAQPLDQALRDTIRRDAAGLAEVLFPIMGPSIRRAIAEALRDFINNINGTVGEALSWQGVKWRMQAMRTGRPYGEVVLSHRMSYRVEQALLIQKDSGLVISKAELSAVVANDSDAFSAMLNAIQDFVSDSLEGDSTLSTLDMGERTIWIIRGPYAHLACVISGVPQGALRTHLADVLDDIHNLFGDRLDSFAGDPESVAGIESQMARCLDFAATTAPAPKRAWWPFPLLLALLLGFFVYQATRPEPPPDNTDIEIQQALDATPGLIVQNVDYIKGQWQVRLLRDPLAPSPDEVLGQNGMDHLAVAWQERPFVSLDPAIAEQRAVQVLALPPGVTAQIDGDTLRIEGEAPRGYIKSLNARGLPSGISKLDTQALEPTPETSDGYIRQRLEDIAAQARATAIMFANETDPLLPDASALAKLQHRLGEMDQLLESIGGTAHLILTGWSDGIGDVIENHNLRLLRAAAVDRALQTRTMLAIHVHRRAAADFDQPEVADMSLRRVELDLHLYLPIEAQP